MTRWFVKDLAKLTHISVQTLHHYDRIALLKPSDRLSNGYRVYTEKDLSKLQQIIALKYFGFELKQVKSLISRSVDLKDQLQVQSRFLEEKASTLKSASETLKRIISEVGQEGSLPWETIIQLIEVFRMTQELEKTWAGKVLNKAELEEYASFEHGLKKRFSDAEKSAFEKGWSDIVHAVSQNLSVDPSSEIGFNLAKKCMDWVNGLYGKKHAQLRTAIWEKGYMKGQIDGDQSVPTAVVEWLDRAMDYYCRSRLYKILDSVRNESDVQPMGQWNELLDEMYGDAQSLKNEMMKAALSDDKVSSKARNWLKRNFLSK